MSACKVCSDSRVVEIDRAIVTPGNSLREVGRRFGLHRSAVGRHAARHVKPRLKRAVEERQAGSDPDLLEELLFFAKATKNIVAKAYAEGNWRDAVGAIRAGLDGLRLKAELLGELRPEAPTAGFVLVFEGGVPKTVAAIETTATSEKEGEGEGGP